MASTKISVVIDVGANIGQYAMGLRSAGYHGRIISFEPQQGAFEQLAAHCANDPSWECWQLAVGDDDGSAELFVSANWVSSSFLPMEERHLAIAPESRYTGREVVQQVTLDTFFRTMFADADRVMLKVDAQGYELNVLRGARNLLGHVAVVELEVLLDRLYRGQATYRELVDALDDGGLSPVSFDPGFTDPGTGQVSWLDMIFLRRLPLNA